jgi:hypothetical protein
MASEANIDASSAPPEQPNGAEEVAATLMLPVRYAIR